MTTAYDQTDYATLPPLTRAICNAERVKGAGPRALNLVPTEKTLNAITDAIRALETRVIALET